MDAVTEQLTESAPRKRRLSVTPAVEVAVLCLAVCEAQNGHLNRGQIGRAHV